MKIDFFDGVFMEKRRLLILGLIGTLLISAGCGRKKEPEKEEKKTPVPTETEEASVPEKTEEPAEPGVDIEQILGSMTLEEKLCQMMMPSFRYEACRSASYCTGLTGMRGELEQFLQKYHFGGIILFEENFADSKESAAFISALKTADGGDVPLLIGTDQEGGVVYRIPFGTGFPGNMALGATGSYEDIYSTASIIGDELASLGMNLDFAPVADVNNEPKNPIIGVRSFSDDPAYTAECVVPYMKGLQDRKVVPVLKHFPGHGDTATDSHTGLPLVNKTYEEIKKCELVPFKKGIEQGADMIMTAHIQYPLIEKETYVSKKGTGVYLPATLSKKMITDILRKDLGFNGVVISDALQMDAVKAYFKEEDVLRLAVNAGIDMMLMPADFQLPLSQYLNELESVIQTAVRLAEAGEIDEKRINESVRRILKLKAKYGLFSETERSHDAVGSYAHHRKEMGVALDAVTTVVNDGVLPVKKDEKIIFFVPYTSQVNSVKFALEEAGGREADIYCYGDDSLAVFRQNGLLKASQYDKVIAVSSMYSEGYLNGTYAGILDALLEECRTKNIPAVLISSQLPYDLARFNAGAKLACYYADGIRVLPGNYEGDVARYGPNVSAAVLTVLGIGVGTGKLPVDIPELYFNGSKYTYSTRILYPRTAGK